MPESKRPRKRLLQSSVNPDLTNFPDPAELEQTWKNHGVGSDDEALNEAQFLVYDAWDAGDDRSRNALARKALKLSPICADAWLILADRPSLSSQDRRAFLQRAVKAGELAIGKDGFEEFAGHFWGFLETRPYMRARHCLAEDLWQSGNQTDAIGHLREMLHLNPNDNQGLRYVLLAWLLHTGDDGAAEDLLREHSDEASTFFSYTRALLVFRKTGDNNVAQRAAKDAFACNRFVPGILGSAEEDRYEDTGYYSPGGEDEAAYYVVEYGFAWRQTAGAVNWLIETTKTLKPYPKGNGHRH